MQEVGYILRKISVSDSINTCTHTDAIKNNTLIPTTGVTSIVFVICDLNHRRISFRTPGSNLVSIDTVRVRVLNIDGVVSPILSL